MPSRLLQTGIRCHHHRLQLEDAQSKTFFVILPGQQRDARAITFLEADFQSTFGMPSGQRPDRIGCAKKEFGAESISSNLCMVEL
mmetsp:Transcript_22560/g.40734  ORF Transcript_22560/g.40734 Transcript_22560/m.40734 type:complete len:85 (-) Transcript_22560:84-338(-)